LSQKKTGFKEKLFAHIETWRLYTVIWCGLVSLAGSCLIYQTFPPVFIAVLSFFIPMMGWTAGLYLSDFLDRKLDLIEKPHRPIPSGRIHPYEALTIGGLLAILGLLLSFYLSYYNIILVFVVALLVYSYTKITKSKGILGNLNRGMVTVTAFLFGVFSKNPSIDNIPFYIWLLCFVFLFHDTNSNLVGAIRDMEGDKKGGYNTIPVKYGLKKSIIISFILTLLWWPLLLFLSFYYGFLGYNFYLMIIVETIILICLYAYLIQTVKSYSRKKALRFHEFFVIERIVLGSALIFGVAEVKISIFVLLSALLITVFSQILLRKRYEFEDKK